MYNNESAKFNCWDHVITFILSLKISSKFILLIFLSVTSQTTLWLTQVTCRCSYSLTFVTICCCENGALLSAWLRHVFLSEIKFAFCFCENVYHHIDKYSMNSYSSRRWSGTISVDNMSEPTTTHVVLIVCNLIHTLT